jgi:glyoxylase-like metal-dependent hydrolase (beta-lactamase superfamily II)
MSDIKAYAVGMGDMFYVKHGNGTFTLIDCNFPRGSADPGLLEVEDLQQGAEVTRFISTHPDQDHISGIDVVDDRHPIVNFYCVENEATKSIRTAAFIRYTELRDSPKAFHLHAGVQRKWLTSNDDERGSSGFSILWPKTANADYKAALAEAKAGGNANNICPIIRYSLQGGGSALWMGDLEEAFLEAIEDDISLPETDIVFAPHHGRDRIPAGMLAELSPQVIVLGNADSKDLVYYPGWDTITQNTADDILFECRTGKVDVFTHKRVSLTFLADEGRSRSGMFYAGSFDAPR